MKNAPSSQRRPVALIVARDAGMRRLVRHTLADERLLVVEAESVAQGQAFARLCAPRVVVVDVPWPILAVDPGLHQWIQTLEDRGCPVVVLVAPELGQQLGTRVSCCLLKPFSPSTLRRFVRTVFGAEAVEALPPKDIRPAEPQPFGQATPRLAPPRDDAARGVPREVGLAATGQPPMEHVIDTFLDAAQDVLAGALGWGVSVGVWPASGSATAATTRDVTVVVGVAGALEGNAMYSCAWESALGVAGAMLGRVVGDLDERAQRALAELGTMMTGRACLYLASAGYPCELAPPVVVLGSGFGVHAPRLPRWSVALQLPQGTMELHLAVGWPGASAPTNRGAVGPR